MQLKIVICAVSISGLPCKAKDLGVVGTVFEIHEKSLLKVIEERLLDLQASGKIEVYQKMIQEKVLHSIERPQPVADLQKATSYHIRDYDPSFILDKDIKDHEGNVIGVTGTTYNPLDYHSFGKPLLLIDGDDTAQVSWALPQLGKIVLVQGKPLQLREVHGRTFFFDQGGVLVRKLGISRVPARVSQKNKVLVVEEVNPKG